MSHFTYQELRSASVGTPLTPERPFERARLWTDTRTLQVGDFFLPLSGERFDGHDYLRQAIEAGAVGAFVQRDKFAAHPEWRDLPNLIGVDSPIEAYLGMARLHREKINPLVIAVTGSSGKTTTKEMLAAAFSPLKKTVKTEKNFNNEVGVCQTLLALTPGTEVLVVEMGMRGLRQICMLSEAARPDAALIVNIGPAHIGLLGSLENIAKAKLEIAEGMDPRKGVLVINADTPHLSELAPQVWPGRLVSYRLEEARGMQTVQTAEGLGVRFHYADAEITLGMPGEHMVANALGVLKVGESLGFAPSDLAQGLSRFVPEKGRGEKWQLAGFEQVWVINDAYNANPDSMQASLKAFLATLNPDQRHILVLSGMKELGDFSRDYHEQLGRWLAGQTGIDALFCVGEEGQWVADAAREAAYPVHFAPTVTEVADHLLNGPLPLADAMLYLKGSRAYQLDALPELLTQSKTKEANRC